MKYYTFTCTKLVLGTLLKALFYGCISLVMSIVVLTVSKTITTIAFLIVVSLGMIIFRVFTYWKFSIFDAFTIVRIDDEGVTNRYCSLKWSEIKKAEIEYLTEPVPRMLKEYKYGMLFCLCKDAKENSNFLEYDKKNVIFVPYNDTILAILKSQNLFTGKWKNTGDSTVR